MKTPSDADASEAPAAPADHTIVIVAISVLMEISPGGLFLASKTGLLLESASVQRNQRADAAQALADIAEKIAVDRRTGAHLNRGRINCED